jgi:hypothetical protein
MTNEESEVNVEDPSEPELETEMTPEPKPKRPCPRPRAVKKRKMTVQGELTDVLCLVDALTDWC